VHASRYTAAEISVLGGHADRGSVRLALSEARRAIAEREQGQRLREAFGDRLITLPYLTRAELTLTDLELLAQEMVAEETLA
jgi:hypothetical protein